MTTTADSSQTDPPTDRAQRVQRYTAALADSIELKWQAWWDEQGTFAVPNPGDAGFDASKPKFFCLDMFPYPSGAGLHVGHPEGYTATDIISRYKRHNGFNVLHPMGWDAFGLPAEQYAIQTGVHPAITTRNAIDNFRRQLKRFGFSYDWSREFATIDEDYYRWTQWIWLKAYNAWYDVVEDRGRPIDELAGLLEAGDRTVGEEGEILAAGAGHAWADLDADARRATIDGQRLAYLGEQVVNWCPKLGTVLANEEVIDGRSERGSHPVLRRPLKQWIFRITAYADRLLADLDPLAWPTSTKKLQADWIGRSEGAEIDFPVEHGEESIRVFTTRPDTIFGATYMVLAPEHPLVDAILASPGPVTDVAALREYVETARNRADVERMEAKEKTGVDTGVKAINPANGAVIPIWVADYVLMGYGHGAIMAVPAHDQRDLDFAEAFELPVVDVVEHAKLVRAPGVAMPEPGVAVNSSHGDLDINGMQKEEAIGTVIAWLERNGRGRARVNFKLRDWLFSRQRYWGEPFPIVYDEAGNHFPVDASALPVVLPDLEDYTPAESDDPQPLLAKATEWMNTTAGAAGVSPEVLPSDTPVRRESNTMPGWAGSCWYYLRYCDPACDDTLIGAAAERYWMRSTKDGSPVGDGAWDPEREHVGGVDLYIGGAEHAVLHLLYARFWHKILFDLGHVSTPEPAGRLFHQGMITSFAYQRGDKTLVPVDEVEEREVGSFVETATGEAVAQITAKMSKSLKNVYNPDDVIAEFGADTFRLYEMYMGPLDATKPWNPRDIQGPFRFLQRAWRLVVDEDTGELTLADAVDTDIEKRLHRTIHKVGGDIERLAFNTAIAAMIEFVNAATSAGGITAGQLERFAVILAPFAPHMAEELWSRLGRPPSIVDAPWPTCDQSQLTDDTIEMPVQILGKVRGKITVPADADPKAVEALALADERIAEQLEGKNVAKVIVVPGRIVNIIAK